MKKLLTFLCALALIIGITPSPRALEGEALRAADTLSILGLIQEAEYDLDAPATRADAVTALVKLAAAEKAAAADVWFAGFRDIPAASADAINYAAHQGWVTGMTTHNFRPDYAVSANAWFTMLLRMLGYSDKAGDFEVADAALFARRIGLTPRAYAGTLTQADLYESMRDTLPFSYRDGSGTVMERLVETGVCSRTAANALGMLTESLTARQIADRHMAAVFCLTMYDDGLHHDAGSPTSRASGFFITPDGLAVTNYHSIAGCSYGVATLSTGEKFPIEEVVYYDRGIDIAVIRIADLSTEGKRVSAFACLELVSARDLRAGDIVYSIGNPLGMGLSIAEGIISDPARTVKGYDLPCVMTTATISQGSSGGVLLNEYGQAVASTSAIFVNGNNMYLAVPSDPVMAADLTVEGISLIKLDQMDLDPEDD